MEKLSLQILFKNLTKAILFIFCAVPGAFMCLFAAVGFLDALTNKQNSNPNYLYLTLAFIIGSFLVVVGLGKIKQSLYLLVIWSFPLLFVIPVLIIEILPKHFTNSAGVIFGSLFPLLLITIPFLVKNKVDKFYQKKMT